MKIPIIKTKKFTLRPYQRGDEKSLVSNINNKKIYRNTSRIPYPYTFKEAKEWVSHALRAAKSEKPREVNFVIEMDSEVAGGISLFDICGHKAEIGYWLGEKYWGQGVMTQVVKLVTKYGFEKLKFTRIYATVHHWNKASMRVLEKCGYKFEGILRKNHFKDGKYIDSHLFAKVK